MARMPPPLLRVCEKPGSDQEKTFGPTISGLIHRHIEPERLLLWDSKVRGGRPDTMKVLRQVYHDWKAEGTRIRTIQSVRLARCRSHRY